MMLHSRLLVLGFAGGLAFMLPAPGGFAQEEALFVPTSGAGEQASAALPEKARALLDEVKKSTLNRQMAVKQTEIDRSKQDQQKSEQDAANVQKSIDSTTALIDGSSEEINKLTSESRRLEHELAVAEARIAAERLKIEGLRALSVAQTKSLSALARRAEESEARSRLREAELALLQQGKPLPADGRDEAALGEVGKCRKALAAAEAKAQAEERAAQEAVKAAAAKMGLADARESNAKRLADNDLTLMPATPVAERTKPKSAEKPEKKESDAPARKTPAAAASTPKPAVGPARPTANPAARGPFFGR